MRVKIIEKKKLYNGLTELRDYEIKHAINNNYTIKLVIDGKYMLLTPAKLKQGRITNTQKSIINPGQTYKLVGFRWVPTGMNDEQVSIDFDARLRLKKEWEKIQKQKGL